MKINQEMRELLSKKVAHFSAHGVVLLQGHAYCPTAYLAVCILFHCFHCSAANCQMVTQQSIDREYLTSAQSRQLPLPHVLKALISEE